jgi:2-polyprenyl-3-methyl-5-hydroxy-6-metoxy-1,4-benzoquinol methylase
MYFSAKDAHPSTSRHWDDPKIADQWASTVASGQDVYREKFYNQYLIDLVQPKPDELIWDLGCGEGFFSRAFAKAGTNVVGTDLPAGIAIAKEKENPGNRITYKALDLNALPSLKARWTLRGHQFDKVVCSMVLMDHDAGPDTLKRLYGFIAHKLKPGGQFYLINKHPIRTTLEAQGIETMRETGDGRLVVHVKTGNTYILSPTRVWAYRPNIHEEASQVYTKVTSAGFPTRHMHRISGLAYQVDPMDAGLRLTEINQWISPPEAQRTLLDKYLPVAQAIIFRKEPIVYPVVAAKKGNFEATGNTFIGLNKKPE